MVRRIALLLVAVSWPAVVWAEHPRWLVTPETIPALRAAAAADPERVASLRAAIETTPPDEWALVNRGYLALVDQDPAWCEDAGAEQAVAALLERATEIIGHHDFENGRPRWPQMGAAIFYDWCLGAGAEGPALDMAADALETAWDFRGYPEDSVASWVGIQVPSDHNASYWLTNRAPEGLSHLVGAFVLDGEPWASRRLKIAERLRKELDDYTGGTGYQWHEGPRYAEATESYLVYLAAGSDPTLLAHPFFVDFPAFWATRATPHSLAVTHRDGLGQIPKWGTVGAESHRWYQQCKGFAAHRLLVPESAGVSQDLFNVSDCDFALNRYDGDWAHAALYRLLRPAPAPVSYTTLPLVSRHGNGILHARTGWSPDATLVTFAAKRANIQIGGHGQPDQTAISIDRYGPLIGNKSSGKSGAKLSLPQPDGMPRSLRYERQFIPWSTMQFQVGTSQQTYWPTTKIDIAPEYYRWYAAGEVTREVWDQATGAIEVVYDHGVNWNERQVTQAIRTVVMVPDVVEGVDLVVVRDQTESTVPALGTYSVFAEPVEVAPDTVRITNAFENPTTSGYVTHRTHGQLFATILGSEWQILQGNKALDRVTPLDQRGGDFVLTPEEASHWGWGQLRFAGPAVTVFQVGDSDTFTEPLPVTSWEGTVGEAVRQGVRVGERVFAFDPFTEVAVTPDSEPEP